MTYLVTGCAGFIGSAVVRRLLDDGQTVIGIDSMAPSYDVRLKEWRLAALRPRSGFSFLRTDLAVLDPEDEVCARLKGEGIEIVLHLAAIAGVRASVENPRMCYEANVLGTLNALQLCRALAIKKFVLASTSSLYGVRSGLPFREDACTDSPLSPYAASKKAAEVLAYAYHHLHGLNTVVLRYFTVYGPAGRPDMSIFRFIQSIAEGRPVTLYGDGTQARDFTYVDDIVSGTLNAVDIAGYEIINLGGNHPAQMIEVLQRIEELLGRKAVVTRRPLHPADVPATWADTTKARRLLGWEPKVSLEEGLRHTVEWYLANRQWASAIELGEA